MIVMDWTWTVVSEEEVPRLDIWIHLVNRRMMDCVARPELVRGKRLDIKTASQEVSLIRLEKVHK